jgi:hypothetical protein
MNAVWNEHMYARFMNDVQCDIDLGNKVSETRLTEIS